MPTKPATAPEAPPTIEAWPRRAASTASHASTAAAVASKVLRKASAAPAFASRLEPALKPNQPTHSSAAPIMVKVTLCGFIGSRPKPSRGPTSQAPTRPATPALMCTTVPPAKSSAPFANR